MLQALEPISALKANQLYWLGRYAERVYLSLHLLRRYYDRMLDGSLADFDEYYANLNITREQCHDRAFRLKLMYDLNNPTSLLSALMSTLDNGIVLRQDIKTESLAYIQLALGHMQKCAADGEENINKLQPVTDYLLAFFGSIYERVFDETVRTIINLGKLVENIDIHFRFDYPYYRIAEAYQSLRECADKSRRIINAEEARKLELLVNEERYQSRDELYQNDFLCSINRLVWI